MLARFPPGTRHAVLGLVMVALVSFSTTSATVPLPEQAIAGAMSAPGGGSGETGDAVVAASPLDEATALPGLVLPQGPAPPPPPPLVGHAIECVLEKIDADPAMRTAAAIPGEMACGLVCGDIVGGYPALDSVFEAADGLWHTINLLGRGMIYARVPGPDIDSPGSLSTSIVWFMIDPSQTQC